MPKTTIDNIMTTNTYTITSQYTRNVNFSKEFHLYNKAIQNIKHSRHQELKNI